MIYYEKTEGNLEVKLPTIWTDGKTEVGRVREEKRREERRPEKRKSQKKEDVGARKRDGENACLCGAKHISKSNVLITDGSDQSWKLGCGFAWHAHGIRYLPIVGKTCEFCSSFQNVGRRGAVE